jgi:uncharacterized Fe-S cluster protein YjdI
MDKSNIIKYYSNGEVTVVWQPAKCQHSANCFSNLPKVFKPRERPWVQVENGTTEEIVATVHKCPSGALSLKAPEKQEM